VSKIEITRTELVWPGKYDEDGNLVPPRRVSLPFQVVEAGQITKAEALFPAHSCPQRDTLTEHTFALPTLLCYNSYANNIATPRIIKQWPRRWDRHGKAHPPSRCGGPNWWAIES
jgi:hypothetical protein